MYFSMEGRGGGRGGMVWSLFVLRRFISKCVELKVAGGVGGGSGPVNGFLEGNRGPVTLGTLGSVTLRLAGAPFVCGDSTDKTAYGSRVCVCVCGRPNNKPTCAQALPTHLNYIS